MNLFPYKSLFIVFVFLNVLTTEAQDTKELYKLLYEAETSYNLQKYHNALPLLLEANKIDSMDADINYKIGMCYLNGTYRTKALPYFKRAMEIGGITTEVYYYLARCYHLTHQFDEAIKLYTKSQKYISTYPKGANITNHLIERNIDMCEYGKELTKNPLDYTISNLGDHINSPERDHVPIISADEATLIFTSRRPNSNKTLIDDKDGMYYENIYISQKEGENWLPPQHIDQINKKNEHDASVGLSPDGQKLFIYKSIKGATDGVYSGHLYTSSWSGEEWEAPIKMDEGTVNSEYVEPSASITADENTLFFSSNRPGGKGGLDIYMVKRLPNGKWAEPLNLEDINTPYDDDAPFIFSDERTLYFSSKGHRTMGGYDIFMSIYDEKNNKWSEPHNMGYPLNTASNDIYFVWTADGKKGYFSSLREDSHGDLDIYTVDKPVAGKYFMVVKGTVLDQNTKQPISATVFVFDEKGENIVGVYNSRPSSGKFSAIIPPNTKYKVKIQASGYEEETKFIQTPDVKEYIEQKETFYVKRKPAAPIQTIDTTTRPKVGETYTLTNIYFDFDKYNLKNESKFELDKIVNIMNKFDGIKVEIGAHTDTWGREQYNMFLSEKRAESVVNYLTSKGIDKDRLVGKAYGETNPIVLFTGPFKSAKNRRVEFKVLESNRH